MEKIIKDMVMGLISNTRSFNYKLKFTYDNKNKALNDKF